MRGQNKVEGKKETNSDKGENQPTERVSRAEKKDKVGVKKKDHETLARKPVGLDKPKR